MADEVNLRNLALDVIVSVMDKGAYSDKAIHAALEKHPGLEKRDRAFFTRLCRGNHRICGFLRLYYKSVFKDKS